MQQPRDLSLGKALEGAKGTSLKDRDDVRSTCTGGVFGALRCPWVPWQVDVLQGKELWHQWGIQAAKMQEKSGLLQTLTSLSLWAVSHCHTQHKALAVPQWLSRAALCVCPPETPKPSCPADHSIRQW